MANQHKINIVKESTERFKQALGIYIAKYKKEVNVAVTGVESVVFRCKKIESALKSNFSSSALDSVKINSSGFNSDIHASSDYRAHLIKVLAKKAVIGCK